ncbi:IS110 family transposase [Halorhodospira halochloris]|uniref:IS110 family transposase n=1 Tax=Halorhodospira halochloris TaxID=1052 RepID=UPI001EE78205|nr:IS110 family transposase [Halorhodospira halochloris]MCG5531721.1 IS110 family transposase [Halorhodospira halochloris]
MTAKTIGIDLGKETMHVVVLDDQGHVVERRTCASRSSLSRYLTKLPQCRVAMEACAGAHFVGRKANQIGHDARLLPAQYVRAYMKSQKNDYADAEAIAEAATRPTMREVPIKDVEQQELQLMHRFRQGWVSQRTETANRIRAMLMELGITVPKGIEKLRKELPFILEDGEYDLSPMARELLYKLWEDLTDLDERVCWANERLHKFACEDARAHALLQIPGVGPISATAMVAAIGDARAFRRGRDLSAWLGIVPKQYSTGGRTKLLGISKRGNSYLRMLLIHGARSVLTKAHRRDDALGEWVRRLQARKPKNVVVVALANKLARVIGVILRQRSEFRAEMMVG